VEVERDIGTLPSIAIVVNAAELVAPPALAVRSHLKQYNIVVIGYEDGLVVGDEREVRVFDIRHVMSMEFEAVFIVGIDEMAKRMPDLFQRLIYVGITRHDVSWIDLPQEDPQTNRAIAIALQRGRLPLRRRRHAVTGWEHRKPWCRR
jgi:hypothetical protein